jgi:phosphoadenosine phosphosulfate reductase
LYDCGFKRIGCIGCPNSYWRHRENEFVRYPKYKENYIKAFDRMLLERDNNTGWKSGEEVFDWWLYGEQSEKVLENQIKFLEVI